MGISEALGSSEVPTLHFGDCNCEAWHKYNVSEGEECYLGLLSAFQYRHDLGCSPVGIIEAGAAGEVVPLLCQYKYLHGQPVNWFGEPIHLKK